MAADVNPSSPNPCCAQWIRRSQKLEKSRDALRQSVKILEGQIERQIIEIAPLKKEVEKQQRQIEQQKNEISKVDSINKELERQIQDMKVKLSSTESTRSLKSSGEDEIGMLNACILACHEELKSLKELLEEERRKNYSERRISDLEKKKSTEAWKLLADEKRKGEEQKFLFVSEKKKAVDLRISLEKYKEEANEVVEKLNAEIAKAHVEKRQVEVEKLKAYEEKRCAESERTKVEEQKQLMEEERKIALNLKKHAIHLSQKLEEERRKREEIQKKLEDVSTISTSGDREHNVSKTLKVAELKLLKEQLKLERKRVKHAKRVAKQENSEKKVVVQEVHLLKQNLIQILYRLNLLDGLVSNSMGSTDAVQKTFNYPDLTCFKLNDLLLSKKDDYDPQNEFGTPELRYGVPLTCAEPIGECIGLPVSRGCCKRLKTGINSGLESPVGGSLRQKSQSSAVCSTSIHFSDSKLMGSQGIDSVVENSTGKFEAKHTLTVSEFPGAVVQNATHRSCQIGAKDSDGSTDLKGVGKPYSESSRYKDISQVRGNNSKKRKSDILVESVACLRSGASKLHSVIGDKLPNLNDRVRDLEQISLANCSKGPAAVENDDYKKLSQKEDRSYLCKSNVDNIMNIVSTAPTNEKSTVRCTNKKKGCKSMSKYNSDPSLIQEAGPDSSQFVFDQAGTSPGNEQAFLKNFENLGTREACLKLLELDNYTDEVRYINAMKTPLSPNLPEIEMSNLHLDGVHGSQALIVEDIPVPGLSDNSATKHDVLYDTIRDASPNENNCRSIAFEHIYHARRSKNEHGSSPFLMETRTGQQGHFIEHFPAEHNKIELDARPISNDSKNTFSRGSEKSQQSSHANGKSSWQSNSHPFHNCGHTESSALGNLGSSRHSSSSMVKLHKAHGSSQPMSSAFSQNDTELKTMEDPIFDRRLNLIPHDADKLTKGKTHASADEGTEHNVQELLESSSMSEVPHPTFSSHENPFSKGDVVAVPGKKICYFILCSSARNMDCVFRIIYALNTFTSQNLTVSETDLMLVEVLSGLILEGLQSEEKVAVFFSFLLGSLSARMSEHCEHITDGDSFQFLESFSMEISNVVSVGKIKCFLDQMFHLDILFRLMEGFLIEREVLVIGDVKQHPSSFPAFPDNRFHLDVANNCVLSKDVTTSQFIAGCTILASICVAADDIDFLLTFAYKMLRTCQDDMTSVLRALHVFATICGKYFFNLANYSFLGVTISSVVTLLEGRKKSVSDMPSHNHSLALGLVADFSSCKQCPFAADAICMDKLIRLLLDVLEVYSVPKNDYPFTNNYFITSDASVPTRATSDKGSSDGQSKFNVRCSASCAISRYLKVNENLEDSSCEATFCNFTDIISLVELVDHYMGWDWTYKEAIPRLLKMVQLCVREVFSTALFVLLGKLGRHVISICGYRQTGIAELRCGLTESLDLLIARKASLPTQVAAVGALLDLLPLNFRDILNENQDITFEPCESSCIKNIQKWFSQLIVEQQEAVKDIFDEDDGPRR